VGVSKKLTKLLKENAHLYEGVFDIADVLKVNSVEDFDRLFTCKFHNIPDTDTYYDTSSSIHLLPQINIPLLLLNALDDPIVDQRLIPLDLPEKNPNVILVTTEYGGHLSWCEGVHWPTSHWHERFALEYFDGLLNYEKSKQI